MTLEQKRASLGDRLGISYPPDVWPKAPAFPAAEYQRRVADVAERAARQGFGLLVVTEPRNIAYLTGYDAHSYYVPQAALVHTDSAQLLLVLREMDLACVGWLCHLGADQVIGYPDRYVSGFDHPMAFVGGLIHDRGWGGLRIGIGEDAYGLSVAGLRALLRALPGVDVADAGLIIEWARTVKSPLELDVIRKAGKISDRAMLVAQDAIAPGVSEGHVAGKTYQALVSGLPGIPSSDALHPCIGNGPRTAAPHLSWYNDVYREGAPAMYELGGIHKSYGAGLSRTVFLGTPSPAYRDFSEIAEEGLTAAVERLRAGEVVRDVEAAWNAVTAPHGYDKRARIGYSIGIAQPGIGWIDGTVSVTRDDVTVLEPGMAIHMMVALWEPPVGYALSETFLVHDGAAESVSQLPRQLLTKDAL